MQHFNGPELIPGVYRAAVLTTSPGAPQSWFVRLTYDGARPPNDLIAALEAAGFHSNRLRGARTLDPDTLVVEDFSGTGSGLFGQSTDIESVLALDALRQVFDAAGLPFEPRKAVAGDLI